MPPRRDPGSCHCGTSLKTAFTIRAGARYGAVVMIVLTAAAAVVSVPQAHPRSPVAARVEARATVRILSGVRLHWGKEHGRDGFVLRDAVVRSGGFVQPAKLIEFE
ncbi:MAG TPA: hypothetical protein VIZ66_05995 [Sphingomicrobium sp.]